MKETIINIYDDQAPTLETKIIEMFKKYIDEQLDDE